jgi:hypothetical protein
MTTPELVSLIKKNPLLAVCGVLSIALAVGIYLRAGAIDEANAQLDERSALARRYALNISNGAQLKEQYDALSAANQAIDARMIRASDIGINQQFFYKLESESGVKLIDLRQGNPGAAKGGYAPVPFTVSMQGEFVQVIAFLHGLEDETHYCRVLTASCTGGRKGLVTLTLDLELLGRP